MYEHKEELDKRLSEFVDEQIGLDVASVSLRYGITEIGIHSQGSMDTVDWRIMAHDLIVIISREFDLGYEITTVSSKMVGITLIGERR